MKLLYFLYTLFYACLIYLGFYYLELDAALWAEFSRVGWESYDGLDLDYPENQYYLIWTIASLVTMIAAWRRRRADEDVAIASWAFLGGLISLIGYGLLFYADGRISLKESQMGWLFTGTFQILIGLGGVFNNVLARMVKISLKQLFFLNGVLYAVALGLGFYFLNLDNKILAEMDRLGETYQGIHYDFPENTYHFILAVLTVGSLFLGSMIKKVKKVVIVYPMYKWLLVFFFLYSVFVFINDGNPDMGETQLWWLLLTILTSILSFVISGILENKLPEREKEIFHEDAILDDLSSLE